MKIEIVFNELKKGGFVIWESVTETCIGGCSSFAGYIVTMRKTFFDPFDNNMTKEDFVEIFTSTDDRRLIHLFMDKCKECGERLVNCDCKDGFDLRWAKEKYPQLFR